MIDEIYTPATTIARLQHDGVWYADVEVTWVYLARPHPVAPYAELIADYARLAQRERTSAEQFIDEHFTKAEVLLLRRYLKRSHGLSVAAWVIPLPTEAEPAPGDFMMTPASRMVEADQSGRYGWHRLDDTRGALPFQIAAWYCIGAPQQAERKS